MDEGLLNDLLECSVCLERLDTSSRVLPCQHTFCLKCLKVIVESHKELRCPECRVVVEARVDELPPNVLLMRILEGMRNSTPRKPLNSARLRASHSQAQAQQGVPRGDAKQLPPHARAMHDFISKEPGDLSFKKGDTILLQKKLDSYWYQGENSGRTGIFPITYVQVVVPLPVPTALCKALYDFRMSAPDEEGCLAFDKGAIITVHRRVDENWAEGRLDQRVGIFPIAFVELNQPARQLMNSIPLNRPVPPLPDHARPGHSEHRHHAQLSHRYQPMSMSAPSSGPAYQNMAPMTHSHPAYSSQQPAYSPPQPAYSPPQPAYSPPQPAYSPPLQTPQPPHNPRIMEAAHKHSLDLIHFTNVHTKHQTMVQSAPRIGDSYDRLRLVKYDYNSTPVHKVETTYQNVRDFPVTIANFTNVSSDSSSSMNTPSVVSSTTTPNTSSDTSTCESAEPSLPGSPDTRAPTGNDARVTTGTDARVSTGNDARISTGSDTRCPPVNDTQGEAVDDISMGVLTLNESSTATNTSLNVTLPESPKSNAPPANTTSQSNSENDEGTSNNEPSRSEAASSKNVVLRGSGGESLLNFGLGLQAALSASGDHREKRHSLTPTTHLQGNHAPQNRHSAEIVATSLLDGRRRARSHERPLPAAYVALYAYRPQKPDELELRKGGVYTVTERCRDGWFKGWSERSQRSGVFPGNYVAPTSSSRSKHEKSAPAPSSARSSGAQSAAPAGTAGPAGTPGPAGPAGPAGSPAVAPPDAPPRANSPTTTNAQQLLYTWSTSAGQSQQSTPRSEKSKDKSKAEKSSISGVSLMKRLAAMKKCKSPPPAYSMDNPVFEDAPSSSLMQVTHPVHVRSGSCPSQLLRTLPGAVGGPGGPAGSERLRHKERPSVMPLHEHHAHRSGTEGPWMSQHRKSQSLDVTATRRDRHHSQPVKERFRCIVPYPPNSEYELELKVDDIVLVSKKRGDGWYKGTLQRTGRSGLFPASFVQSCPPH